MRRRIRSDIKHMNHSTHLRRRRISHIEATPIGIHGQIIKHRHRGRLLRGKGQFDRLRHHHITVKKSNLGRNSRLLLRKTIQKKGIRKVGCLFRLPFSPGVKIFHLHAKNLRVVRQIIPHHRPSGHRVKTNLLKFRGHV